MSQAPLLMSGLSTEEVCWCCYSWMSRQWQLISWVAIEGSSEHEWKRFVCSVRKWALQLQMAPNWPWKQKKKSVGARSCAYSWLILWYWQVIIIITYFILEMWHFVCLLLLDVLTPTTMIIVFMNIAALDGFNFYEYYYIWQYAVHWCIKF